MKSGFGLRILNLLVLLVVAGKTFAWTPIQGEKNIVITSSIENYRFEFSRAKRTVEVKQETSNQYSCLNYRDQASYYEFFDQESTLDDVTLFENGKKAYVDKSLADYSVEDIFYSDARIFSTVLNFPKSGWQNEIKLKKTISDPRYFCTVYFDEIYAITRKEITITIPRWMKVELKEYNFEGYNITKIKSYAEKEDADIIKYIIKDLPPRTSENSQPGPSFYLPHILFLTKSAAVNGEQFTYFNTLKDQYNWYRKITSLVKNDEAVVKAKALEITKHLTADLDKVKAILYWVHDNIRYIAFEDGLAGFKPDESQHVLNKKYGDCKGMANLTKELLKSIGFDARLAWIGTNYIAYDYSTPSLCVDNHMICCLIYKDKKYYLDGTESYLAFGNYAERIQGRPVLIENGENYMLEKVPVSLPDQNLCRFTENLVIANNSLSGSINYLYRGESKEQFLTLVHQSKTEKLDALLERYISNDNKTYIIQDIKTSDLSQTDGDLNIQFKVNYSGAVSSFGKELYIDLDYNKFFNKSLVDTLARHADYRFQYKYNYITEVSLAIPADYRISSLPTGFEIKDPSFHMLVSYTVENNKIKYVKRIIILNTLLKKQSFTAWNQAIAKLSSNYLDQVILEKK